MCLIHCVHGILIVKEPQPEQKGTASLGTTPSHNDTACVDPLERLLHHLPPQMAWWVYQMVRTKRKMSMTVMTVRKWWTNVV